MASQKEILEKQRKICEEKIAEKYSEPSEGLHCDMVFDNIMCWDEAEPNTVVKQLCPDYVNGLIKDGFAYKYCTANGTWYTLLANDTNNTGWTDYNACVPPQKDEEEFLALQYHLPKIQMIYNIGYGISLASLIIAVAIMLFCKRLHCKSNSLHMNLFIAFILRASVSFLKEKIFVQHLGLPKDIRHSNSGKIEFIEEGTHWECKLLVTVFIYTLSASLMWIFVEGLYLHMLVYRTLFTERSGVKYYVIFGWTAPLIFVVPWILVRIYLEDEFCWTMNRNPYYFWILKGPILLIIVVNFIFFIDIIRVLIVRARSRSRVRGSGTFRKVAKFALVLIPLFGVTYIIFAAFPNGLSTDMDIPYLYCEMFYNSFQGFVLALLFCFLNEEVHSEIKNYWRRRRNDSFTRSIFLSSIRKGSYTSKGFSSTGYREDCSVRFKNGPYIDRNENPVRFNSPRYHTKTQFVNGQNRTYSMIEDSEPTVTENINTSCPQLRVHSDV